MRVMVLLRSGYFLYVLGLLLYHDLDRLYAGVGLDSRRCAMINCGFFFRRPVKVFFFLDVVAQLLVHGQPGVLHSVALERLGQIRVYLLQWRVPGADVHRDEPGQRGYVLLHDRYWDRL